MRKYSENLFNAIMEGKTKKTVGNHKFDKIGDNYYLKYHNNTIMVINHYDNIILVDECGWHTQSTIQAINSHLDAVEEYFGSINGYEFVDLSENKYYAYRIKSLFGKIAMSEAEFVEANK